MLNKTSLIAKKYLLVPSCLMLFSNSLYGFELIDEFDLKDGLYFKNDSGSFTTHVDIRAQVRFTNINYDTGHSNEDPDELKFNRARLKLGGKLGADWLKYYTEYDFVNAVFLDMWVAPKVNESLHFRIGQYKVPYNRERFDSSGKQQFAERSIVNSTFTLDRQTGITAMGRLFKEELLDSNYYAGIFLGDGRGASLDGSSPSMAFVRWQFNLFQRVLPFSRSDIERHEKPSASLAFATARYEGPYTKFSTTSTGALSGLSVGIDDQYTVNQFMIELAFMYQGFSMQSEYHFKNIDDGLYNTESKLNGFYFDIGYFPSEIINLIPKELEVIARYARVNPDDITAKLDEKEIAFGANWFFYGHRNKLTLDVTRNTNYTEPAEQDNWTTRFQWDVSF